MNIFSPLFPFGLHLRDLSLGDKIFAAKQVTPTARMKWSEKPYEFLGVKSDIDKETRQADTTK